MPCNLPPAPRQNNATPVEEIRVVVAYTTHVQVFAMRSWEDQQHYHGDLAFPIALFCANKFDVRDAKAVGTMLVAISNLPLEAQIARIDELEKDSSVKHILTLSFTHYTVLDDTNGYEFVCKKWADTLPFVQPPRNVFYKGHPNLGTAIKYLLARGVDPQVAIRRNAELSQLTADIEALNMQSTPTPATPTRQPHSPARSSSASSTTARAHRATRVPSTPATPTSARSRTTTQFPPSSPAANSDTDDGRGTSTVGSVHAATRGGTLPRVPGRNDTRTPRAASSGHYGGSEGGRSQRRPRGSPATANDGDTPQPQQNRPDRPMDVMPYIFERDIRGNILQSHFEFAQFPETEVPILGKYLDDLLDSAGMPDAFITAVYSSYIAARTCDNFAVALSPLVSFSEAAFLWRWIRVPALDQPRMRVRESRE